MTDGWVSVWYGAHHEYGTAVLSIAAEQAATSRRRAGTFVPGQARAKSICGTYQRALRALKWCQLTRAWELPPDAHMASGETPNSQGWMNRNTA